MTGQIEDKGITLTSSIIVSMMSVCMTSLIIFLLFSQTKSAQPSTDDQTADDTPLATTNFK